MRGNINVYKHDGSNQNSRHNCYNSYNYNGYNRRINYNQHDGYNSHMKNKNKEVL